MSIPLFRPWFAVVLISITASCVELADEDVEDVEIGETEQEVESYFCVDHPCPDLVPRRYSECLRFGSSMPVRISNNGAATAGASKARFWVDYYGYSRTYDVPSIAPGSYTNLWISLPSYCLTGPGCSWGVLADSTYVVTEISGTNNTARGACVY